MLLLHRVDVASGLRMVAASNYQLGVRNFCRNVFERLHHQLEALVSSPLAERENAVLRITAAREVRELRAVGEDAVRAQMNVVAAVLVVQDLAIAGHQHRD